MLIGSLYLPVSVSHAEVYRWVDEKGQVHYADQAQGAGPRGIKTPAAPAGQMNQQQRMEKTQRLLNAYQVERQQQREQAARQQEAEEKRARNCARARDNLRQYSEYGSFYRLDKDGNRVYLSEQERAESLRRSREAVKHWCD